MTSLDILPTDPTLCSSRCGLLIEPQFEGQFVFHCATFILFSKAEECICSYTAAIRRKAKIPTFCSCGYSSQNAVLRNLVGTPSWPTSCGPKRETYNYAVFILVGSCGTCGSANVRYPWITLWFYIKRRMTLWCPIFQTRKCTNQAQLPLEGNWAH